MPPITRSQSRGLCLSKEESIVPPGTAAADDIYKARGNAARNERRAASSSASPRLSLSSNSSSNDDDDERNSTVVQGLLNHIPRPPESATKDEWTRYHWEFCYGASGEGGGGEAKSWSANRAPPVKSCLSSKKRAHTTTCTTKSTSIPTRGKSQQQRSPTPMLSDRFTFGGGDGRVSPIGHTHQYSSMAAKEVKFGSPSAAEFDKTRPPVELTPLPADSAREMYSVDGKVDSPDQEEEFDGETARNDAVLAPWEKKSLVLYGVRNDDDDDEGGLEIDMDWRPCDRRARRRRRQSARHGTKRRQTKWLRGGDDDRRSSSFFALSGGRKSLLEDPEASEANVETAWRKEEEEEKLSPVQLFFYR